MSTLDPLKPGDLPKPMSRKERLALARIDHAGLGNDRPVEDTSVRHMEVLDHPANVGDRHQRWFAHCGRYVATEELARHVDLVTCLGCAARLAELEALDL